MRKALLGSMALLLVAILSAQCVVPQQVTPAELQTPNVTLQRVEIAHYWPFLLDMSGQVPGFEGIRHGSALELAFIFNVENPNNFDVMLDALNFTVAFEEFELQTVGVYEDSWIPARKTNQVRVNVTFDSVTVLLSLLVTGGFKLQEQGISGPEKVGGWWEGVQDFAFPIHVAGGTADFKSAQGDSLATFEATFP
jgi:hypothetical protein